MHLQGLAKNYSELQTVNSSIADQLRSSGEIIEIERLRGNRTTCPNNSTSIRRRTLVVYGASKLEVTICLHSGMNN